MHRAPCEDSGHRVEELAALIDPHLQDVADRLSLEADGERLAVEPLAAALVAGHVKVGKKVHRDLALAQTPAGFAAASPGVEAEPAGLDTRGSWPRGSCANTRRISANRPVGVAGVERGLRPIGAWSTSTSWSIASSPETPSSAIAAVARAMQKPPDRSRQHVVHQRALARAADTRDARQGRERNPGVDLLQVMKRCAAGSRSSPGLRASRSLGAAASRGRGPGIAR